MYRLFSTCTSKMKPRVPYASSKAHRDAQRGNAATEILGTAIQSFSPALVVPRTLAQALISGYCVFRPDTHISEKIIHFLQMVLAAAQLIIAIILFFDSATCSTASTNICKTLALLQYLYIGILLVGWGPSEYSKDPYVESVASTPAKEASSPLLEPSSPHDTSKATAANADHVVVAQVLPAGDPPSPDAGSSVEAQHGVAL